MSGWILLANLGRHDMVLLTGGIQGRRCSKLALVQSPVAEIAAQVLASRHTDIDAAEQTLKNAEANSVASGKLALYLKAKVAFACFGRPCS